ncbi:dehydrogenase [Aureimonas endophytica]|uniref:Dehydrogenase n=1 Tax=Aureimonas endophytica TaxID=2027858 RepID=A0A917E9W8_9HYPH|nr:Gfo/Idh/MocA family oxidoreductase [Aureimonas endophytica]GGE15041.1 dehydrogenase [Aureimonas endophytica]
MSKLRMGVVGAGLWGANHAHAFNTLPETELVAVCDVDETRAAKMREATGAAVALTDYRALIARDDIDAISVATPDFTHSPIILAALKADKHVLSEKPLATTVAEAEEIAAAARASKGKLMVDFHNRVNPVMAGLKAMVEEGQIGLPRHGMARLSNTQFVPFDMLSWAAKSSALWFLGSHLVDILRFVLADEVVRVYAVTRKGLLAAGGVDTADVHQSILEFSKGTIVTMENSWILSRDNPSLVDFKLELVGDKGQVQADPTHNGGLRRVGEGGLRYADYIGVVPTGSTRIGGFVFESIARFVDSVVRGDPLLADAEDGLANTRILAAIETSAASGRAVDLS